jgi:hypothetical protein
MKNKWLALIILILISGWISSRSAQAVPTTDISGTLIFDTTLTAANSPYFVTGTVFVNEDVTLTVQPGVEIRFVDPTYSLDVSGTLIAEGTAEDPIVFTSNDPSSFNWSQLYFRNQATASLRHCVIEHAGNLTSFLALYTSVRITSSDVTIEDCIIRDGDSRGVYIDAGFPLTPTLRNITVTGHVDSAIYQASIDYQPTYENLTLVGNGADVIEINGGSIDTLDKVTLVNEGAPYRAIGGLGVSSGSELVIEPGVELQFADPSYSLDVSGSLIAEGTTNEPVVFTSADPNAYNWGQLFFRTNASASLQHCVVEHAGSSSSAIRITSSDVIIADCIIRDGESDGVFMDGVAGLAPTLRNVTLADHAGSAIRQFSLDYQPTYDNLTIAGNGADVIDIDGGYVSIETVTLVDEDVPYVINGGIGVNTGSELRLDPGVEMQFATANQLFDVYGTLTVEGTADELILLTSADPDSYNWRGIFTRNNSSVSLQHCIIEHAGSTTQGALAINSGTDVTIRSCTFTDNNNAAIVTTFAQPTIKDNTIADNAFAIRNDTPATVVDATNNYWGSASGPLHPTLNPTGQGNQVSDGVLFDPWFESSEASFRIFLPLLID